MTTQKLQPLTGFKKCPGPILLIIMDGIGIGKEGPQNAVHLAHTPFLDAAKNSPLYRQLKAHGTAVGMPSDEDMGNSEVGHNALGAGRYIPQGATLVKNAIDDKSLFKTKTWNDLTNNVQTHNSTLHFIGLLSDGNVHAHMSHLLAMLDTCQAQNIRKVRLHILLDGRDVKPRSALTYTHRLESHLHDINKNPERSYKIASGGGRMVITMDRYNADWNMVKHGWETHVLGEGPRFASAEEAITHAYRDPDIIDQYIPPFIIESDGNPCGPIQDHDSVIFFNFRGDRAIELSRAFDEDTFTIFDRKRHPKVLYAGMMEYDGDQHIPKRYLVTPPKIDGAISTYLCHTGIHSFAISETQKYGHVTYFWNGNKSGYINKTLETYIEIPSLTLPFHQQPEMQADKITEETIKLLKSGTYTFGRVNFPNGDMIGHTGNLAATIKSVEKTDQCVQKLVNIVNELNGITVILADHGNADSMYTEKNGIKTPQTAHTLNPVPFVIIDKTHTNTYSLRELENPGLTHVAATLCNLLGYKAPENYDTSLIHI